MTEIKDIFISEINIVEIRNLKDLNIKLSTDEKKHLIITGKNGSGKTTLLNELKVIFNALLKVKSHSNTSFSVSFGDTFTFNISLKSNKIRTNNTLTNSRFEISFDSLFEIIKENKKNSFVICFFGAKRNTILKEPKGITKVELKENYDIEPQIGNEFIQYIVNLKADKSFARDDEDLETIEKIDEWFNSFENSLKMLFDNDSFTLEFDRKNYNFFIIEKNKEPYTLNQLSDGYSAIFSIVTELIMRMEKYKLKSYDVQGIVLIDEIEAHLHVELQKKILPFLTSFFPKIQFIVTTHSPFVINSLENAIICDLEKHLVLDNLSGYSYDTIIESYFDSDKYSTILKNKLKEYEILLNKKNLTEDDRDNINELKFYFKEIPKFISPELSLKIDQLEIKNIKS